MKESISPNVERIVSGNVHLLDVSPLVRVHKGRAFSADKLTEFFTGIENYLTQGFVAEVEERCFEILENYRHSLDVQAQLNGFISQTFEMQGRFNEALEILKPFEDKEIIKALPTEVYATLLLRQGIAYGNLNNSSKAISSLTLAQRIAEERDYIYLLVNIHTAFARVYRNLSEFSVSRNYVDKAIKYSRRVGDWRGFAEASQISASGYQQEGNSQEAINNFQEAIQMIGSRSAPFLLGKIYSDISVVYWSLFRSQEGIESAKKAINILEKTGNKYQTAIAYNNLGTNLLLSGDWKKAEEVLNQAIDSALETNHAHLASFICTAGELNLLRGDYEEAENLFTRSFKLAEETGKEWYSVQILHNLARCLLAQNKSSSAIKTAQETINRCEKINENHFKHLTFVILAESYLKQKKIREAEEVLFGIEEIEPENLPLQGCVARLRGSIALENKDEELAVHHFSRSLSIFDKAGDVYHTALADYKLGVILAKSQSDKADKHLTCAVEAFRKLKAETKLRLAEEALARLKNQQITVPREHSTNSHLLMLRLIESISSRETLFRELVGILAEEEKDKRLILADVKRNDFVCAFCF
ncbi:MAG: tetratricopeptide repeat protein [Blastocatellia bacterium]|nr:tetratricopeptide repeat protein [Blastocatellia bacterium]